MTISAPPPQPPPTVPVVDAAGRMKVDWYQFLFQQRDRLTKLLAMFGTGATTVAALPSAAKVGANARAFVTDASATTFHSTVASGGSNKVPVVSDGTNWLIG